MQVLHKRRSTIKSYFLDDCEYSPSDAEEFKKKRSFNYTDRKQQQCMLSRSQSSDLYEKKSSFISKGLPLLKSSSQNSKMLLKKFHSCGADLCFITERERSVDITSKKQTAASPDRKSHNLGETEREQHNLEFLKLSDRRKKLTLIKLKKHSTKKRFFKKRKSTFKVEMPKSTSFLNDSNNIKAKWIRMARGQSVWIRNNFLEYRNNKILKPGHCKKNAEKEIRKGSFKTSTAKVRFKESLGSQSSITYINNQSKILPSENAPSEDNEAPSLSDILKSLMVNRFNHLNDTADDTNPIGQSRRHSVSIIKPAVFYVAPDSNSPPYIGSKIRNHSKSGISRSNTLPISVESRQRDSKRLKKPVIPNFAIYPFKDKETNYTGKAFSIERQLENSSTFSLTSIPLESNSSNPSIETEDEHHQLMKSCSLNKKEATASAKIKQIPPPLIVQHDCSRRMRRHTTSFNQFDSATRLASALAGFAAESNGVTRQLTAKEIDLTESEYEYDNSLYESENAYCCIDNEQTEQLPFLFRFYKFWWSPSVASYKLSRKYKLGQSLYGREDNLHKQSTHLINDSFEASPEIRTSDAASEFKRGHWCVTNCINAVFQFFKKQSPPEKMIQSKNFSSRNFSIKWFTSIDWKILGLEFKNPLVENEYKEHKQILVRKKSRLSLVLLFLLLAIRLFFSIHSIINPYWAQNSTANAFSSGVTAKQYNQKLSFYFLVFTIILQFLMGFVMGVSKFLSRHRISKVFSGRLFDFIMRNLTITNLFLDLVTVVLAFDKRELCLFFDSIMFILRSSSSLTTMDLANHVFKICRTGAMTDVPNNCLSPNFFSLNRINIKPSVWNLPKCKSSVTWWFFSVCCCMFIYPLLIQFRDHQSSSIYLFFSTYIVLLGNVIFRSPKYSVSDNACQRTSNILFCYCQLSVILLSSVLLSVHSVVNLMIEIDIRKKFWKTNHQYKSLQWKQWDCYSDKCDHTESNCKSSDCYGNHLIPSDDHSGGISSDNNNDMAHKFTMPVYPIEQLISLAREMKSIANRQKAATKNHESFLDLNDIAKIKSNARKMLKIMIAGDTFKYFNSPGLRKKMGDDLEDPAIQFMKLYENTPQPNKFPLNKYSRKLNRSLNNHQRNDFKMMFENNDGFLSSVQKQNEFQRSATRLNKSLWSFPANASSTFLPKDSTMLYNYSSSAPPTQRPYRRLSVSLVPVYKCEPSVESNSSEKENTCKSPTTYLRRSSSQMTFYTVQCCNVYDEEILSENKGDVEKATEFSCSVDALNFNMNTEVQKNFDCSYKRSRSSIALSLDRRYSFRTDSHTVGCISIDSCSTTSEGMDLSAIGTSWGFPILKLSRNYESIFVEVAYSILNEYCGQPVCPSVSASADVHIENSNGITCSCLGVPEQTLLNFVRAIRNLYQFTPYHNEIHAAAVGHAMLFLCHSLNLFDNVDCRDKASIMIAALCHDVGHPGRNNLFFINSYDQLAIIYNDQSVLENFHAYTTFKTLDREECDLFINVPESEFRMCRQLIIELILATDMKQHFEAVARLKVRTNSANPHLLCTEDRGFVTRMCLKLADLSHSCLPWDQHFEWSCRIGEEFYMQGDEEINLELPISPLCDRSKHLEFAKSQSGFLNFVVRPLVTEIVSLDQAGRLLRHLMKRLNDNYEKWNEFAADAAKTGRVVTWPEELNEVLCQLQRQKTEALESIQSTDMMFSHTKKYKSKKWNRYDSLPSPVICSPRFLGTSPDVSPSTSADELNGSGGFGTCKENSVLHNKPDNKPLLEEQENLLLNYGTAFEESSSSVLCRTLSKSSIKESAISVRHNNEGVNTCVAYSKSCPSTSLVKNSEQSCLCRRNHTVPRFNSEQFPQPQSHSAFQQLVKEYYSRPAYLSRRPRKMTRPSSSYNDFKKAFNYEFDKTCVHASAPFKDNKVIDSNDDNNADDNYNDAFLKYDDTN